MEHVRSWTSVSSCIIGILVVIVASLTLVAKWAALRQIHNEIVTKYNNYEGIYFDTRPVCQIIKIQGFNAATFPFACVLIIICVVVSKRKSFMPDKCHGYIAPAIPIDFLSHIDRKFAAVVFAVTADELLDIVRSISGDPTTQQLGVLVSFLRRLLQVLIMGCRFYPILACVHINSKITLACATLYAWLDYSFTIVTQGLCTPDFYPNYDTFISEGGNGNESAIRTKLDYYGTGPSLIAIQLVADIPRFACLAYISIKLPAMLIGKFYGERKKNLTIEKKMLLSVTKEENILLSICQPNSVEMLYVRNLFRSPDQRPRSHAFFARLIPRFIYEWRDDFRFSSRVLCIYSSIFLLLYYITIQFSVRTIPQLYAIQTIAQGLVDAVINTATVIITAFGSSDGPDNPDAASDVNPVTFPLPNLVTSYIWAATLTVTVIVIQLLVLLANIRRNLFQVYRGDDSEIPRRQQASYVLYSVGNIRFAGYFIGYLIWGFIILAVFWTIVCICLGALFVFGRALPIEKVLKAIIPGTLLAVFKIYLNKLLAQYVFLHHYGEVLALNNRRCLMIFIYFNFFLDAFLGIFAAIIRLIETTLGTIFYMCRLDYAPLGRKLENFDGGFTSYCGFIHTECTHRHPVMLVFVSHLFNELRTQQYVTKEMNSNDIPIDERKSMQKPKVSRFVRKWRLAAFLVRNLTIVFFRKTFIKQLSTDEQQASTNVDQNRSQRALAHYIRQMAVRQPSLVFSVTSEKSMKAWI
jgi:hypothetical protein